MISGNRSKKCVLWSSRIHGELAVRWSLVIIDKLCLSRRHEFSETVNGIAADFYRYFNIHWKRYYRIFCYIWVLTLIGIAKSKTLKDKHIISMKIKILFFKRSKVLTAKSMLVTDVGDKILFWQIHKHTLSLNINIVNILILSPRSKIRQQHLKMSPTLSYKFFRPDLVRHY